MTYRDQRSHSKIRIWTDSRLAVLTHQSITRHHWGVALTIWTAHTQNARTENAMLVGTSKDVNISVCAFLVTTVGT